MVRMDSVGEAGAGLRGLGGRTSNALQLASFSEHS